MYAMEKTTSEDKVILSNSQISHQYRGIYIKFNIQVPLRHCLLVHGELLSNEEQQNKWIVSLKVEAFGDGVLLAKKRCGRYKDATRKEEFTVVNNMELITQSQWQIKMSDLKRKHLEFAKYSILITSKVLQ